MLKGALAYYESQSLRKYPNSELGKDIAGYNLVAKNLVDLILGYCAAFVIVHLFRILVTVVFHSAGH